MVVVVVVIMVVVVVEFMFFGDMMVLVMRGMSNLLWRSWSWVASRSPGWGRRLGGAYRTF